MTLVAFVVATGEGGAPLSAHKLVVQPIFDLMASKGYECKWAVWSGRWGFVPGDNMDRVACFVTPDEGIPTAPLQARTFFHPHGLHPLEQTYCGPGYKGYLSPGEYWLTCLGPEHRALPKFPVTGWAKLDKLTNPNIKNETIARLGLNLPNAKTILYAPCGNWDWASSFNKSAMHVINMCESLGVNLIIKVGDYARSFQKWGEVQNYLGHAPRHIQGVNPDEDLTPLFSVADLMISDGSSAAYEFIGLGKPAIQLTNMTHAFNAVCPGLMLTKDGYVRWGYSSTCGEMSIKAKPNTVEQETILADDPTCKYCGGTVKSGLVGLKDTVIRLLDDPNDHADERNRWGRFINAYVDGHCAERCVAEIQKLAGI